MTRDRVLKAAAAMADREGVEALSMRKLAQELGVEAMSLYNHVSNKDEILNGIVELVAQKIDLANDEPDWRSAMTRRMVSAHGLLSKHRWAATLWMASRGVGHGRTHFADSILRGLREAGFSKDLTYHAFHVLQGHVLGYTMQEGNLQLDHKELKTLAAEFLRNFPTEEYPDFAEHVQQHLDPPEAHKGAFEFGLDLILDSLERLRDGPAPKTVPARGSGPSVHRSQRSGGAKKKVRR